MCGINALIIEAPESSLGPSTMCGHRKKTVAYEPESGFSSDTEAGNTLILDFQLPEQ